MKKINLKDENFHVELQKLTTRPAYPKEIELHVSDMLAKVKENGDSAVVEFAKHFDNADLIPEMFKLTQPELDEAVASVPEDRRNAIDTAIENVKEFALKQSPKNWTYSPRNGVVLGEKFNPLNRICAYIPGGTAPLVSSVVHTVAIAKAVGVKEIAAITPPTYNGSIIPELVYAMVASGADEIYRIGGVYGIAAFAYGTETIKKAEKIVGPGNAYVTAAKKMVYGDVAIDMVAGPSEIMIIADKYCNPDFIAADILSQAEHGSGHEQAVLVTDSEVLAEKVKQSVIHQSAKLSRKDMIEKILENGVFFLIIENMDQAARVASEYAPEHLEILCEDAENIAENITAAGAIFLGEYTPEPLGDFVSGPSHVLPTAGSARFFSGISAETFLRRSSILKYTKHALERETPAIEKFAAMEGLDAHGNSALIRFNSYTHISD